jgi:hypothetical protein
MTHPEPTAIDDIISQNADVLGLCVASTSSEALRNQVDRATEHLGRILTPEQMAFIKDMVAQLVDGDPILAQLASWMRATSVAPSREAAGSFCEGYLHLSEAAGSFCRVSNTCRRQPAASETPLPRANRRRAAADARNHTCEKLRGAHNEGSDTCKKLRGASNECAPLVAGSGELLERVGRKFE